MQIENLVAAHYTQSSPTNAVLAALARAGADMEHLTQADLAPFEHLHMGGRQAIEDLGSHLDLRAGMQLLDIGCGIGGSARYFAHEYQCRVSGIDLTAEFVALAEDLTRRIGMLTGISFQQGSALRLPFGDDMFDRAYLLHVGMNIADKSALFGEAHRVLKPGGLIGVYDVMRLSEGALTYPMPWAGSRETSFVVSVMGYQEALQSAGFAMESERDLWKLGIAGASAARGGGSQVFMGDTATAKQANLFAAVETGIIAPVQLIARKS